MIRDEIIDLFRVPVGKRLKLKDHNTGWKQTKDINAFEQHLVRNGTIVLKFFLNVSKAEQKKRFLETARLNLSQE